VNIMEPRFDVGQTTATARVTAFANREMLDLGRLIWRHHCGDWGDLCAADRRANGDALLTHNRIFSSYELGVRKIYAITEADRCLTTVMFADEY
jgi:hypothetical protein